MLTSPGSIRSSGWSAMEERRGTRFQVNLQLKLPPHGQSPPMRPLTTLSVPVAINHADENAAYLTIHNLNAHLRKFQHASMDCNSFHAAKLSSRR